MGIEIFWNLLTTLIIGFFFTRGITAFTGLRNFTKNYDKTVRPLSTGPTNVSVQIAVVALGPISTKTLSLKTDVFLRQWWHDERLNTKTGNILNYNLDPANHIWVPDIFISNARETTSHKVLTKNIKTVVGPNGSIFVSARLTLLCSCRMRLERYPMDAQQCSIDLESYAFTGREISLDWKYTDKPVDFTAEKLQVSGYEVISVTGIREVVYYLKDPYPKLRAIFKIKRSFPYFLYHIYLPGALLVALSWSTFYIPPAAVPARVTLIVTNFLSTMFIFSSTGSLIPKEPYITALEIYSLGNIVFIILVMVEYIFVLKYKTLDRTFPRLKIRRRPKTEDTELQQQGNGSARRQQNDDEVKNKVGTKGNVHLFDSISRFMFPLCYLLFIIVYFLYFKL